MSNRYWHRRSFRAMGAVATLVVADASDELVDWAVEEIARMERSWSRFLPDSDLCSFNAAAGSWVELTPLLAIALDHAAVLWRATQGAFDPTIITALERIGYDRSFEGVASDDSVPVAEPVAAPGLGRVELHLDSRVARLPAGCRLDLGGVGKGLAADRVAEGLIDRGARSALVSLGGDMRAAGESPQGGWTVPVEHPARPERPWFHHVLHDGALVQSTCAIRSWSRAGTRYHHIIDPSSGAPASSDVTTVVVAGPQAWWAEGLAKAAIVTGRDAGVALLRDAGVEAWLIDDVGVTVSLERSAQCPPS